MAKIYCRFYFYYCNTLYSSVLKKIIAISLLVVLLFSCTGGWMIYKVQQQLNYLHVRHQLKKAKNITTIILSVSDYENSKVDKHEIKLNDKMYDVERVISKGDSVIIYCMADEKEDGLIASYFSFEKNKTRNAGSDLQILKFLSLVYIQTRPINAPYFTGNIKVYFAAYSCFLKPSVINIESPPPKLS